MPDSIVTSPNFARYRRIDPHRRASELTLRFASRDVAFMLQREADVIETFDDSGYESPRSRRKP